MKTFNIIGKVLNPKKEIIHLDMGFIPREREVIIKDNRVFRVDTVIYNTNTNSVVLWLGENENDRVKADN
ncbi:hypothetical protein NY607_01530 [Lysinibacillus sp. A4]|uniref:hypothetical protein n=1 Tax=Lysinibacillus sp. A4 TaxID=2976269 RepID=UPI002175BE09|nr:hypothetical protein [Lysinibacillus sp. A4]MCS5499783.1 hypothetical protein [Lysinibacillus sp. A4]